MLFTLFLRVDVGSVLGFVLFGTTDPYVSPMRQKELDSEFREMVEKEFGFKKKR